MRIPPYLYLNLSRVTWKEGERYADRIGDRQQALPPQNLPPTIKISPNTNMFKTWKYSSILIKKI